MNRDELKYKNLIKKAEKKGLGWGIKFTKANGDSWAENYPTIKYKVGKTIEIKDSPKDGKDCGHGLHLGKDFIGAGNYNLPEKIFFCTYKKVDLCGDGTDKVRVRKLKIESELPRWMGYGKNGKKILSKIDKNVNPEDFNPYQREKLPSKNEIKPFIDKFFQVGAQVGAQLRDQVWDQVGTRVQDQVWDQVGTRVWDQVGTRVWDRVGTQVGDLVWAQVGTRVGTRVWAQVLAVSYWAMNIHFDLGIKHWFGDFLKLGVMLIFVNGKVKVFGKNGKYLGEYGEEELK